MGEHGDRRPPPDEALLEAIAEEAWARRMTPEQTAAARAARAEAERQRAEQAAAEQAEQAGAIGRLLAAARAADAEASVLPCHAEMALPDGVRSLHRAVDACAAAGARDGCARWKDRDPRCPRRGERAELLELADHLYRCRIPGAVDDDGGDALRRLLEGGWREPGPQPSFAELMLATFPGRRDAAGAAMPPRPLRDLPALRLVRAFLTRAPAVVDVGATAPRTLVGNEWALVMGGSIGVGKTTAACAGALAGRPMLFTTAAELVQFEGPVPLERARTARLLVIDDLGDERDSGSGHAVDTLTELLTLRQRNRRLTIVTTNLRAQRPPGEKRAPEGLRERYGERLYDRLREGAHLVGLKGESQR